MLLLIACVTLQAKPLVCVNLPVEEYASKIYTRAMFEQFGHNLYQAGAYRVEEVENGRLYLVKHTKPHKREKWSRVVFEVKVVDAGELFECECWLLEHMGILLPHSQGQKSL
jgi:predicted metalloenzyme YecM